MRIHNISMGKKVIILIALMIILTNSLASAGFWDLITGKITSGLCTPGLTQNGYCFGLKQGWNLISIPLVTNYTAESLLDEIKNEGGDCNSIQKWDGSGWQTHPYKARFNDFGIIGEDGYFIYCNSAFKWSAIGNLITGPLEKKLAIGWNLVGSRIDLENKPLNSIVKDCDISKVIISDINQEWETISASTPIQPGQGYFMLCNTQGIWDSQSSQTDCIDSDVLDSSKKGNTKGILYSPLAYQNKDYNAGDYIELEDYCFSNTILNEYSCFQFNSKSYVTQGGISCSEGCKNGVCVQLEGCAENWTCGDWSICVNEQETRTCTDSNNCGTTTNKPSEIQDCRTAILLKSEFFSSDLTANDIAQGKITYDINEYGLICGESIAKSDKYGFKILNAIKQLGYLNQQECSEYKEKTALLILNEFQRKNGLTESNYVDQNTILKLDAQIKDIEIRDITSNQFACYKYFIDAPPNDASKNHLAFLYMLAVNAYPENLRINSDNLGIKEVECLNPQPFSNDIEGGGSKGVLCDPGYWSGYYDNCTLKNAFEVVSIPQDDFTLVDTIIHEYAHFIDINGYVNNVNNVSTTVFYSISYNISDKVQDGFTFYKPIPNINDQYETSKHFFSYAEGWQSPNYPGYWTAYEDFAVSMEMYILQGIVFRDYIKDKPILAKKYEWIKENIFKGVEFDTGDPNYASYVPDLSTNNIPGGIVAAGGITQLRPNYVWDYNLALLKNNALFESEEAIPCSGCLYNEKCLPIGTRVKSNYCDIDGVLKSQRSESSICNNNYECATNVCVNDKCISQAIWDRFISWLKRIFR